MKRTRCFNISTTCSWTIGTSTRTQRKPSWGGHCRAYGPSAVYRRDLLLSISERFMAETFFRVPCILSNDKCLTRLIHSDGYHTSFSATLVSGRRSPTRWERSTAAPALVARHVAIGSGRPVHREVGLEPAISSPGP